MEYSEIALVDIAKIKTGKLNSNAAVENGKFPFFTCAPEPLRIDRYKYDQAAILLAGNNAEGNFHINYFKGKFEAYQRTYIIDTKDSDKYDLKYIFYALKECLNEFKLMSQGTSTKFLTMAILNGFKLKIPCVEIQRKISRILSIIDEKIDTNVEINRNLEEQARSVFTSWFVRFECFDEPMKESPIGFEIPESLDLVQIGDLNPVLETGRRPKGGAVSEGIPSIGAESVKGLGNVNLSSNKYIPIEFAAKQKTGKVNGYELMIYKDGGKPGEFHPHFSMFGEGYPFADFYINEHVFKLDFGNRGFNELAYFYFQTDYVMNWLESNGGKAAIPGINQNVVNSIWIVKPGHPKVKEYCEWVQPLFTQILKNCYSNMKLAELRDTLLPKLMSGELDVSDLDI